MKIKKFKCDICEKLFKTKNILKNHFNQHHNNSGKVYYCDVCTKSFQTQRALVLHKKSLHEGKHYNCESCGKSFSQAVECDFCGK